MNEVLKTQSWFLSFFTFYFIFNLPLYKTYIEHLNPPVAMTTCLTCDEGGHSPANQVVEAHGAIVDVAQLAEHAVGVQALQEEPGEGAQVEEVQQDGDARAGELEEDRNALRGRVIVGHQN